MTEKYYNEELNFKVDEHGYHINTYNYDLEIDTEIFIPLYLKDKLQTFSEDVLKIIKESK